MLFMFMSMIELGKTAFKTEMRVRPDEVDLNRHAHASKYMDYVLAARYDQMERCYLMSMEEFLQAGYTWFVRSMKMDFKRPLGLGERFFVQTWIDRIEKSQATVFFEIRNLPAERLNCSGWFVYSMVSVKTGRPTMIPKWILDKYCI